MALFSKVQDFIKNLEHILNLARVYELDTFLGTLSSSKPLFYLSD